MTQTLARRTLVFGLQHYSHADLERAVDAGERLQIYVVGLARIADNVSPEPASAAIESVTLLGDVDLLDQNVVDEGLDKCLELRG